MDTTTPPPGDQQQQQTAYNPPPPPPPPQQQKKGFNWLACCGISCLVLVIIGALMAYGCYRMAQPFINLGMDMARVQEEVASTDATTIRSAATSVTADTLAQSPEAYKGQWVAVEGNLITQSASTTAFSSGDFSTEDATQYVLEGNILVMDFSQSPRIGSVGDTIRAYGKPMHWDLTEMGKMPIVGKFFEEELRNNPDLAGNSQVIFFIAKEVELVESGEAESEEEQPVEESEGWIE